MKWLEGWFGTASGVLGILWLALVSLTVSDEYAGLFWQPRVYAHEWCGALL